MSKAFKIIDVENFEKPKTKHPDVPFVIMDEFNNKFLVFFDNKLNKYRYINLDCDEGINVIGSTESPEYDSLEDMFIDNDKDVLLDTELVIKGLYKE